MSKFRRKPVVIEAIKFIDHPTEIRGEEPDWYKIARSMEIDEVGAVNYSDNGVLLIHTLEGVMTASPGDWIIRGVAGEIYACKPDIFEKTYEEVSA